MPLFEPMETETTIPKSLASPALTFLHRSLESAALQLISAKLYLREALDLKGCKSSSRARTIAFGSAAYLGGWFRGSCLARAHSMAKYAERLTPSDLNRGFKMKWTKKIAILEQQTVWLITITCIFATDRNYSTLRNIIPQKATTVHGIRQHNTILPNRNAVFAVQNSEPALGYMNVASPLRDNFLLPPGQRLNIANWQRQQ